MNKKIVSVLLIGLICLALVAMTRGQRLFAELEGGSGDVPPLISYQGFLADSLGDPVSDGSYDMTFAIYTASSSGSKVWEETQSSVAVSGGYFSVMLGSGSCTTGCPLGSSTFSEPTRYLETTADISGSVTFPRQQLGSVPYAFQVEASDSATGYEHVITVATTGGDYASVANALDSITDSSSTNRYLVRVMPGVYTETDLIEVKAYVHVRGSGTNVTVVTSSRSSSTASNASATVDLLDNGRISDITVRNTGSGTFGIALYSAETSRDAIVDNVMAEAIGSGGTGHYAAYWNDAEAIIRNSTLFAGGAVGFGTAVNAAFGSVNISAGFPQALIEDSILIGGANNFDENCNDGTGTGFGLQLSSASPLVRGSYICGSHRAIAQYVNGHTQIQNSSVKGGSNGSAFMVEISASGSVKFANSGVSYPSGKFTGAGTGGMSCVHTYDLGTFAPLTDAINNSTTACN